MEYPKISMVIGSFNRCRPLELCIEAVRKELLDESYEIIVVDGGSTDGTIEWLAAQRDIISIIQHNRGEWQGKPITRKPWAYFMNLGFKCAAGEYICMLSDDSLIIPGAINNGVKLFDEMLGQGRKLGGVAFYFRDYPVRKNYAVAINVGNLYVNHGLFLNEAMKTVGYCDETNYHFYFADTDVALKIKEAGYEIIASEQSFVEHYFEATPEIRASNTDDKKLLDRQTLLDKWEGVVYPEKKKQEYIKHVGYWKEHSTGFQDPDQTIQKLMDACHPNEIKTPLVSVITVVKDDPEGLEKTIKSIINQNHRDFEYIVIDGKSREDTQKILHYYKEDINILVSEPDKGIYDAMNKGIDLAFGSYSIFLNAGDEFSSCDVLSRIKSCLDGANGVIYGHRYYIDGEELDLQKSYSIEFAKRKMPYCHQAAFYRTDLLKKHKFNLTYKFASDYNQVVELYISGCKFRQIDEVICKYASGGLSESGLRPYLECLKIQFDTFGGTEEMKHSVYMRGFYKNVESLLEKYRHPNEPSIFRKTDYVNTGDIEHADIEKDNRTNAQIDFLKQSTSCSLEINDIITPDIWLEILFADLYFLKGKTYEEKVKIRALWLKDFIKTEFRLPEVNETGVVFFRSLVRDDYKAMFHKVIEASGITERVVVEDYKVRSNPSRINLKASRYFIENRHLANQLDIADPMDRTCCTIRMIMYKYILDHIRQMRFRALVCFADMQPVEHLLARYFRAQGITTVTMQHGLYIDYGSMDTVNVINYLHQPSEYFLSWGQEISELIAHHHADTRIVECGKPLIFEATPPPGHETDRPYISLLLDQKLFHAQNEEMIEIVRNYASHNNLDLRVRFHPSLPKSQILKKYPGMTEQLHFTDAELVVGHTSSLLYEALALDCRVLRYKSDIPAIPLPETFEFSSVNEMWSCLAHSQPNDLSKRYFTAIGNEALKNYRAFFESQMNDTLTEHVSENVTPVCVN